MDGLPIWLPPKPAIIVSAEPKLLKPGPLIPASLQVTNLIGFGAGGSLGNDSFTKILLHMDGTDGSTTFADSNAGGASHTWTANGNAQIDTAISKFGGAAGLFDGAGDYVTTSDHADFTVGSGDFTVDAWFNRAGGDGTLRFVMGQSDAANTATERAYNMYLTTGNKLAFDVWAGGAATSVIGATSITATGWHHGAFVRSGTNLYLFLDGVQDASASGYSSTIQDSSSAMSIGRVGALNNFYWNGSLDELRLSVGTARWTSNFTPPTAAYS